jgi:hypothetical protein
MQGEYDTDRSRTEPQVGPVVLQIEEQADHEGKQRLTEKKAQS